MTSLIEQQFLTEVRTYDGEKFFTKLSEKDFEKCNISVEKQVNELINIVNRFENVIIVSNELGMGIVPSYPLGRYFREITGKMNQEIAEIADEAYFVVSGIPMKIK